MRDVHTLSGRRGTKYPTVIAAVSADYSYRDPGQAMVTRDYWISAATLTWSRRKGCRYTRPGSVTGSAEDIHRALQQMCRRHGAVWLFAGGLYRLLIALGVYDAIDGETWTIASRDDGANGSRQGSQRRPWSGYCVVEDRTTILVIRRPRAGVLHAVDTSNFGCAIPRTAADTTASHAGKVLDWARDYIGLCHDEGLGTLQHTIASQAWYSYRMRLPRTPIVVHAHEPTLALERDCLLGGRCEAYQIGVVASRGLATEATSRYGGQVPQWSGVGPIYHLDARSLYGSIARITPVPTVFRGYRDEQLTPADLDCDRMIADVDVACDTPCLPLRLERPPIVVYPTGQFRTQLCGPELRLAIPHITRIHRAARYDCEPIFQAWADRCWSLRRKLVAEARPELLSVVKLLGQVLYGKWGQQARGWRASGKWCACPPGAEGKGPRRECALCGLPQIPDRWALWWEMDPETKLPGPWRAIGGRVEQYHSAGETYDSCPVITAWINSAARVWLWQLMQAAGRAEVLYCDTDSVIVTEAGYDNLVEAGAVIGDGLGELRVVGVHSHVEIVGVKHYVCDGRLTCAGPPPLKGQTVTQVDSYRREEPISSACRNHRPPLAREVIARPKQVSEYRHGVVCRDGRVTPFQY